ncbi:NifB/NifX family molybdenum-iron cluster-binding protein [Candidatus Lokiarchaeum ossiferum]|uniref:NifB/NifX family molybdenum-iron cluster-binding protein n=1 Tax=Candidatus Lokiarchaeum ossiferum TaxID=2951803 RepID=UPI00352D38C6
MKRYSIATDNGQVSQHFGRCPTYTFIDVENSAVVKKTTVQNPGHQVGTIPKFLHENSVNVIIAGGMGRRAIDFFNQYNIQPILGASGTIENIVDVILSGELKSGDSTCVPRKGKDYGLPKEECDESHHEH